MRARGAPPWLELLGSLSKPGPGGDRKKVEGRAAYTPFALAS
jgi:hypothetical protein